MNAAGSNLVQVTTGDKVEAAVNKGADKSVIPLVRKGETVPEASSGGLPGVDAETPLTIF